jgi:hypothetical protein
MPEPTEPLSDDRLAEIRKVQLGDWYAEPWQSGLVSDDDGGHAEVRCGGTVIAMLPDWAYPIATWIAESHDDVPLLLAEVDRLRAETDSLHVVVERASVAQYSASDRATNLAEQMGRLIIEGNRLRTALATAEALAAEYGARIVAASMAAAPRETPGAGR